MWSVRDHGLYIRPVLLDSYIDAVSFVQVIKLIRLIFHASSRSILAPLLNRAIGKLLVLERSNFELLAQPRYYLFVQLVMSPLCQPLKLWLEIRFSYFLLLVIENAPS